MTKENSGLFMKSLQSGESIHTSTEEGFQIFLFISLEEFQTRFRFGITELPLFLQEFKIWFSSSRATIQVVIVL